jgi:hypothetical protein
MYRIRLITNAHDNGFSIACNLVLGNTYYQNKYRG